MQLSHPRQVPAPSQRRAVARGVREVHDVRMLAEEHLFSARPQTLLQTGLRRVSKRLFSLFGPHRSIMARFGLNNVLYCNLVRIATLEHLKQSLFCWSYINRFSPEKADFEVLITTQ
jgi:hypothetical protein